jgi:hypothetical protein
MALEAALPGLRTLSSAHAAVRSEDGLCGVHDRYVAADYGCSAHEPAVELKRNPAPAERCRV